MAKKLTRKERQKRRLAKMKTEMERDKRRHRKQAERWTGTERPKA
jgi:hypothetical protein